jgi:DNA-binding transcriptional MerR regulator
MDKSKDAFRTISEVAEWLGTPTHVLRFWESRFTQVKPVKRAGGRRYYRPSDMELLGGIKKLLHDDGMTIRGVQKLLREEGVKHVSAMSMPIDGSDGAIEGTLEAPVDTQTDLSDDTSVAELRVVPSEPVEDTADNVVALEISTPAPTEPDAPEPVEDRAEEDTPVEEPVEDHGDEDAPVEEPLVDHDDEDAPVDAPQDAPENVFFDETPAPPAPAAPTPIVADVPEDPADDDFVPPAITDVASTLRNAASSGTAIEHTGEALGSLYDRLAKLRARMDGDTDA